MALLCSRPIWFAYKMKLLKLYCLGQWLSRVEGPDSLLNVTATDGAVIQDSSACGATNQVTARRERDDSLFDHADLTLMLLYRRGLLWQHGNHVRLNLRIAGILRGVQRYGLGQRFSAFNLLACLHLKKR